MSNFQIGDRVKLVRSAYAPNLGATGTIIGHSYTESGSYRIEWDRPIQKITDAATPDWPTWSLGTIAHATSNRLVKIEEQRHENSN